MGPFSDNTPRIPVGDVYERKGGLHCIEDAGTSYVGLWGLKYDYERWEQFGASPWIERVEFSVQFGYYCGERGDDFPLLDKSDIRFLSAYLDKAPQKGFLTHRCCPAKKDCENLARPPLEAFFSLSSKCKDQHWAPQSHKMESKYWKYINFVGHIENAREDIENVLRKVGMDAWEKFSKSGWGADGQDSIFSNNKNRSPSTHHAKNAAKNYASIILQSWKRLWSSFPRTITILPFFSSKKQRSSSKGGFMEIPKYALDPISNNIPISISPHDIIEVPGSFNDNKRLQFYLNNTCYQNRIRFRQ